MEYNIETYGKYKTEDDAKADFDNLAILSGMFHIEKEVPGKLMFYPKSGQFCENKSRLRIDRILYPKEKFLNAGWVYGPIGIEIKKSGVKIGKPISQLIDYRQVLFQSKTLSYTRIMPVFFFLFPVEKVHGDIASIMSQNQIGTCCIKRYNGGVTWIKAHLGETYQFGVRVDKEEIEINNKLVGCKSGSR